MKKTKKHLILIGAITIATLSGICIGVNGNASNISNISKKDNQSYSYDANNIMNNVFIENGKVYLPFIFNTPSDEIKEDEIKSEFEKAGLTIKNISTPQIGTGTQITVEENEKPYTILVYGDVNGDGKINLIDAQKVILHHIVPQEHKLEGDYLKAANVNNSSDEVNLIDAQRIILFYLQNGNIDGSILINPPEVEDYIEKIEIIAPTKTEYKKGEKIDLTNGKIVRIYASGRKDTIDMVATMLSEITAQIVGTQTITVTYKTTNTVDGNEKIFTKTFDITVSDDTVGTDPITKLVTTVKDNKTNGYCYDKFNLILSSGKNEESVVGKKIEWIVEKDGNLLNKKAGENIWLENNTEVVKINSLVSESNSLNAEFIIIKNGNYNIKPTLVNDNETITGNSIDLSVEESSEITDVQITGLENAKFKVGEEAKDFPIEFLHIYKDGNTELGRRKIDILYSQIDKTLLNVDGIEVTFKNAEGTTITDDRYTISQISIKVTKTTNNSFKIKIDKKGSSEAVTSNPITVDIKISETILKIDGTTDSDGKISLNLYAKMPTNTTDDVVEGTETGYAYTILPIYLFDKAYDASDVNGRTPIKWDDLVVNDQSSKIILSNNVGDTLWATLLNKSKQEIVSTTVDKEVKYIGIAIGDEDAIDTINGSDVTVQYTGLNNTVTLRINVVEEQKDNTITNINISGLNNTTFKVGEEAKDFPITFQNKSNEAIDVVLSQIDKTLLNVDGIEVNFKNTSDTSIVDDRYPIAKISIKVTKTTNKAFQIKVDKKDTNEGVTLNPINVNLKIAETVLKIDGTTDSDGKIGLNLYNTLPTTVVTDKVVEGTETGLIYTLLPMYLFDTSDVNRKTPVKWDDLVVNDENSKIKLSNNVGDTLWAALFNNSEEEIAGTTTDKEVKYIGIAIGDEDAINTINGSDITVQYTGLNNTVTLKANIVEKEKDNTITNINIQGLNNATFKVGEEAKDFPITFQNKSNEAIDVVLSQIDKTLLNVDGIEVNFKNTSDTSIVDDRYPIAKISIKVTKTTNKAFQIKVDKKDTNEGVTLNPINVNLKIAETVLKIDGTTDSDGKIGLNLYNTLPTTVVTDKVVEGTETGLVYTLLPIYLFDTSDVDEKTPVKWDELVVNDENSKIKLSNNVGDTLWAALFNNTEEEIAGTTTDKEVKYVGIAIGDPDAISTINGSDITIQYTGLNNVITLKANVINN